MRTLTYSAVALLALGAFTGVQAAQESAPAPQSEAATRAEPRTLPDTIMFSIDEVNEVRSRIAAGNEDDTARTNDRIESAGLYLSTILYYGPKEWTIWINGVPISPNQEFQAFRVTDIGPDHVELLVPLSAQGMRPVRLSPNQTFIARSGDVVEGKWQP